MPIRECEKDGKPGFAWGDQTCYTYTPGDRHSRKRARAKANKQKRAIKARQEAEK